MKDINKTTKPKSLIVLVILAVSLFIAYLPKAINTITSDKCCTVSQYHVAEKNNDFKKGIINWGFITDHDNGL